MYNVKIACDRDDSSFICVAPVCRTLDPFFSRLTTSSTEWQACSLAPITTEDSIHTRISLYIKDKRRSSTCIASCIISNIEIFIVRIEKIDDIIFVEFQIRSRDNDLTIFAILESREVLFPARCANRIHLLAHYRRWSEQHEARSRSPFLRSTEYFHLSWCTSFLSPGQESIESS